jgi:hypothetical protein
VSFAEGHKPVNGLHALFVDPLSVGFGRLESLKDNILRVFERSGFETPVNERLNFGFCDLNGQGGALLLQL